MKRKIISFINIVASLLLTMGMAVGASSCTSSNNSSSSPAPTKAATVVETAETYVVIQVETAQNSQTLLDVMANLQADGALTYTLSGTMLQGINGKKNLADWSACWMLYTSDTEMANASWGEYTYNGVTYGSAILGADALEVASGAMYIWVYTTL